MYEYVIRIIISRFIALFPLLVFFLLGRGVNSDDKL